MKTIDITRRVNERIAVWPKSKRFVQHQVLDISAGGHVNLTSLELSPHTGSHADAPNHFIEGGAKIADLPVETFLGEALVVDVGDAKEIGVEQLATVDLSRVRRVLFKTRESGRPDDVWNPDYPYLGADAARLLAERGAILVGIDTPSVDPFRSRTFDAHNALLGNGIVILENLSLSEAAPGRYELIALPLKLETDGSPIRAVLRTIDRGPPIVSSDGDP